MNRFYLIIPLLLAGIFGGVYWQHTRDVSRQTAEKQAEVARARESEEQKKREAEQKARADAEQRSAARLAEEHKKEAERTARWDAESKGIADDTAKYQAQLASNNAELEQLNTRLTTLRATREKRASEAFEVARSIELDRIRKRNAELEIQRLTEILAAKAARSSLASATP